MDRHRRLLTIGWVQMVWLLLAVACGGVGCAKDYDFDRHQPDRGTLGEELLDIWRRDAKRAVKGRRQKTELLERSKTDFVAAVDTIAPPDKLGEVDQFLQHIMALVDDGLVQGLTRKLGVMFDEAAADADLLDALATQTRPSPDSFLSPANAKGFLSHLMSYPRIGQVATKTTEILLASDGVDRRGRLDGDESAAVADLLKAVTTTLADARRVPASDTTAYAWRKVLLTQDARFGSDQPRSLYAVQYGPRGLPRVRRGPSGLPTPFVDANDDGLADIGSAGKFVLDSGGPRDISAFDTTQGLLDRDSYGRGSVPNGDYAFAYLDLGQTGLHFVTRQVGQLAADGLLWNMVDAAPAVLGSRVVKSDARGSFDGYSADNPMTDVVYALLHVFDIDQIDRVLSNAASFIDHHSSELAGVLFAVDEAAEIIDQHPEAHLEDNQTMGYDLVPLLAKISADPGLWRDVFWALRQPITRRTGEPIATLVSYRDKNPSVPELDGEYDSCFQTCKQQHPVFDGYDDSNGANCRKRYAPQRAMARYECIRNCPRAEIFSKPMDFDAPESKDNRSMLQRLFHLLRDTAGTPFALDITKPGYLKSLPAIVELPGAAEAFLRSVGSTMDMAEFVPDLGALDPLVSAIGGNGSVASILSILSPIFGTRLSRRSSADEITRLFNFPTLTGKLPVVGTIAIDPPVGKDGYVMANHHADILYASEASGLIDAISPLACAFGRHGNGRRAKESLLAKLFVIVHNHYSSRPDLYKTADGHASPMKGSNLRSFEPAIKEIAQRGTLFDALFHLSLAADRFKSDNGTDFIEQLRLVVHNATRRDDGFTGRLGKSTLNLADGRTLRKLSRLHVLLDAAGRMADRVADDPRADQALEDMLGSLYDVLFATKWPDGGSARFTKPGSAALLSKMTTRVAQKAAEARQQGRLSEWLTSDQMQTVDDFWDSRTLPALVDLGNQLASTSADKELTDDFLDYLLGQPDGRNQTAMAAYVLLVETLHQDTWVPMAHFLARLIDPARQWKVQPYGSLSLPSHLLQVVHDTVQQDPDGHGLDMVARGLASRSPKDGAFWTVFGVVADYFRDQPTSQQPYTAADYADILHGFNDWLGDDVHGMEQLYDVVDGHVDH